MINFSQTRIEKLSVHGVGNRMNDGVLKLSAHPLDVANDLLHGLPGLDGVPLEAFAEFGVHAHREHRDRVDVCV